MQIKHHKGKIHLKKGCLTGMGIMIMPGVTIGEGAIIGAGSLVTRDIPDWAITTGRSRKGCKTNTYTLKFLP